MRYDGLYRLDETTEFDDSMPPGPVRLTVGKELACLTCPCGCGAEMALNLQDGREPRWKARFDADGLLTLTPSVLRTAGCRSHFFITNGKVVWC